jgi:hypothetical protein
MTDIDHAAARDAWALARGYDLLAHHWDDLDDTTREMVRRIVAHQSALTRQPSEGVIAGALFDFAGHLTTLAESYEVGARHDASRMVEELKAWASKRGLSLTDARVMDWNAAASPVAVTDEMVEYCVDWMRRTYGDLVGVTHYDMRDMLTAALRGTV